MSPRVSIQLLLMSACFLAVSSQSYFQNPCRKFQSDASQSKDNGFKDFFNDYSTAEGPIANIVGVRAITVTYSHQVESIQVTYLLANKTLYQAPRHGSDQNVNPPVNIKLVPGEYVLKIEGQTDGVSSVNQLSITTYFTKEFVTKKYGPFGMPGKLNFSLEGFVFGFYGKARDFVGMIGVYHYLPAKRSCVYGGMERFLTFDENPDTDFSLPVVKIKKLFIYHEKMIVSIQAQYQLLDGVTRLGSKFGGRGGSLTVVKFEDDEEILSIKGNSAVDRICQLTFVSRRHNISNPMLYNGPFGWGSCSMPFSVTGNVLGFSGIAADTIIALGVYYS